MENINKEAKIINDSITNNNLVDNNLLLCNKCFCIPKIDISPYTHKIVSICPNNHEINPIPLDLYLKEELNKSIKCIFCNKNIKNTDILYCKNCLQILCINCKKEHNLSHHLIQYSDLNILCYEHNIKKDFICLTCNKDICNKCLNKKEHINHKIQSINEFLAVPENNINTNLINSLSTINKKEKKQIEIINDMLIKKINKITEMKNIENQVNKRLLNNIKNYPNNYNSIYNINNMIKNNNVSEENYYETISNITNLLEKYINNGNSGKEKLILIKRQNLKNIFFLIIFLILVILVTYFFGNYTNSKNVDNKSIFFNENSNLLKLTEIILNEEQEEQMNNYLINYISEFITQYNNIFNEKDDKKYNISLNYKLLYKGTRDGDKIEFFHKRCENKNNLLFMIETKNKAKFGFFSFNGYKNSKMEGTKIKDINLLLFKVDNNNKIIFNKNICNDLMLYVNPLSYIEVKRKNKQLIYIPNNYFNENNYCRKNIKENGFNSKEDYELNDENEIFLIKDIEVFQIIIRKNKDD